MVEWAKELAYHFHDGAWSEYGEHGKMVPEELYAGVKRLLPAFQADFTHPADLTVEGVSFVMVAQDDSVVLIEFEPPSTTTVWRIGSLAGGRYKETFRLSDSTEEIVGEYSHKSLERPLRVVLKMPRQHDALLPLQRDALRRAERFRDKLLTWAAEPPPRRP